MPSRYMPSLLQQYAYESYLSALQRHNDKFGKPFDLPIKSFVSPCNFFVLQHVKVLENGKWRYINRDVYGRTSQQRWRHFTNPRSFFRQVFDFIRFFLCCGFLCPQYFDLNNVEEGYPLLRNSEN